MFYYPEKNITEERHNTLLDNKLKYPTTSFQIEPARNSVTFGGTFAEDSIGSLKARLSGSLATS